MKHKILLFLPLLAVLMGGCDRVRDVFIPAVPGFYRDYFPYAIGDSIVFTDGTGEMAFEVEQYHIDKEDRIIQNVVSYGTAEITFSSKINDHFLCFGGGISLPNSLSSASFYLNCVERCPTAENTYRNYSWHNSYGKEYVPSTIVFTDPTIHSDFTGHKYHIDHVILIKGKGLCSFYDSKNQTKWTLKEIKKK